MEKVIEIINKAKKEITYFKGNDFEVAKKTEYHLTEDDFEAIKEQLRIAVVVTSTCGNYIPDKTTGMDCVNCGKSHFLH